MRGLLITGTDTGVGKSIVTASLAAAMRAAGEQVRAHKPVVTGLEEGPPDGPWPADHELLALAAGMSPGDVSPLLYGPAVSPHLAAEMAGEEIDPPRVIAAARAAGATGTVLVEGVGGLLVPFTASFSVLDLACALGLPVVIVARTGLGTINHTLLSLHAARRAGLEVAAVVMTPWPDQPTEMELSNRESVGEIGQVQVCRLPHLPGPEALAGAGGELPWRRWLHAC